MTRKPSATKRPPRSTPRPRKAAAQNTYAMRSVDLGGSWLVESPDAISAQTAIRVTAILACVRFIAQSLASCPIHIMRNMGNGRRQEARDLGVHRTLSKSPNFWQSQYEWLEQMAHHTALWGSGYSRILPGDRGFATQLIPIHPSRMKERLLSDRDGRPVSLVYDYWGPDGTRTFQQSEILHFRWLSDNGYSGLVPAELCGTAVTLARKLDIAAAAYWDNSARPDVVLETTEAIPDAAVAQLRQQWREMYGGVRNKGQTAILPKKTTARVLEGSSREAAQFMELRQSIVGEIARAFGIPSTLIGDAAMAKYSNVEQEFLSAQVFTLLPWQRRMEGAIDRSILSTYGDDVYCKLDNRGLLRGDTAARAALYQSLFNMAAIKPNEIRALEDLEILDDEAANKTYMQLGFAPLGANDIPADAPADEPAADAAPADPLAPAADSAAGLASTALNGAQVTALLDVLAQISAGAIDPSAAVAIITSAFPTISEALAKQIADGAKELPQQPQGGTDGTGA